MVGHNREIDPGDYWDDSLDIRENNERMQRLMDMNELRKPYWEIMERNRFFFQKLGCKKQVFDQQFSEKLDSADFGKLVLHIVIDKAVMRQRAAASLLGA